MSSSNKTNYLGLNQFVGSDKPKMEDFNADNRLLDEKIQQHIQSQLHLTEQQRKIRGISSGATPATGQQSVPFRWHNRLVSGLCLWSGKGCIMQSLLWEKTTSFRR